MEIDIKILAIIGGSSNIYDDFLARDVVKVSKYNLGYMGYSKETKTVTSLNRSHHHTTSEALGSV